MKNNYKTRALDLVLSRITKYHAMATDPDATPNARVYGNAATDVLLELHTDLQAEPDDQPAVSVWPEVVERICDGLVIAVGIAAIVVALHPF